MTDFGRGTKKTDFKAPSLRDFLRIIFSYKKLIIYTFLIVSTGVLVVSLLTPPTYEAVSKIMVKHRKVASLLEPRYYFDYRTERLIFIQSQIEIIKSDKVLTKVMKEVFPKRKITAKEIEGFRGKLKIGFPKGFDITNSNILLIKVRDRDPRRAALIANLIMDQYITVVKELRTKSAKEKIVLLEQQAQQQLKKMKELERQIKRFQEKAGPELAFLLSTVKAGGVTPEILALNNNYINAKITFEQTQSALNRLKDLVKKGLLPQKIIKENPLLMNLKSNIIKLENQLIALRSQYTDLYPKNRMVLKQLEQTQRLLKEEVKEDLEGRYVDLLALEARVKTLKKILDSYSNILKEQVEFSRYYTKYKVLEDGYKNILKEIQKARMLEALDPKKVADIIIIDKAKVPVSPVSPKVFLNTLIGTVIGLLLGLGFAFIADYLDHTLKSPEDIERHLDIYVLGTVPRMDV